MTVLDFLKLLTGPEFVYCHVLDPKASKELAQGFADDMIDNSMFSGSHEVLRFYFLHSALVIIARRNNNE